MIINMLEMEHVNGNEGPCINSVYFDQIIEIECAKINGNNLVDEKVTINWTGQKKKWTIQRRISLLENNDKAMTINTR